MKDEIDSRTNAKNVNKGDDVQYSRTHLSGRSKGEQKKTVDLDELST